MRSRRGNGDGCLQQRRDGRWCGIASHPDGGRRFVYGRTRQEAAQKLKRLIDELRPGTPSLDGRALTGEFLQEWLDQHRSRVRRRTWDRYESTVRLHALPTIGRVKLARLTADDIERLYRRKLDEGQSPSSVHKLHIVLRAALGYAERAGIISRSPAAMAKPPRFPRPEMQALSPKQARRFLELASESRHEALYVLAVTTGMRQGELLGLRWSDLDLEAAQLSVVQTLDRAGTKPLFGEPKTRASRRRVLLTERAVEALRRHRVAQDEERLKVGAEWRDYDLVFTNHLGAPLDPRNVSQRDFHRLLSRAGLPRIRFHGLRHTAATVMLSQGVHPRIVADMLGHASVAMTLDVYSHVIPGMQHEAVVALNNAFRDAA